MQKREEGWYNRPPPEGQREMEPHNALLDKHCVIVDQPAMQRHLKMIAKEENAQKSSARKESDTKQALKKRKAMRREQDRTLALELE
ncbi:uncharacterized protein MONOS_15298 [Monocercomonoides exilis]|uniref:uncharacterized protein n=1 Tax=Monocercomonoides exilis TaxID=2049356 RepID=UPI00355A611D|nr:hypothetical protein MONOS_15298 [Monocercomonoides exilis]|eukprot:MONOS_15298.1-p1 / transcript=MONOS_15298.1 / gene=MONOS_15298 / organism=Monocercomonoides_exilis_PA203 / gene_product=unspecified product / transcript_product=unspecified product / location=Mono_scaffold01193:3464-3724(-) / protein_length=87 / sequence_SO=supercontig / SO=protein_coding / is_pseudo=false